MGLVHLGPRYQLHSACLSGLIAAVFIGNALVLGVAVNPGALLLVIALMLLPVCLGGALGHRHERRDHVQRA